MIHLAERPQKGVRVKDTEYRIGGRGRPAGATPDSLVSVVAKRIGNAVLRSRDQHSRDPGASASRSVSRLDIVARMDSASGPSCPDNASRKVLARPRVKCRSSPVAR